MKENLVSEECKCKPCESCGFKHACNLMIPHPEGYIRAAGSGCPAELIQLPKSTITGSNV